MNNRQPKLARAALAPIPRLAHLIAMFAAAKNEMIDGSYLLHEIPAAGKESGASEPKCTSNAS
jgi:hypothetical protein